MSTNSSRRSSDARNAARQSLPVSASGQVAIAGRKQLTQDEILAVGGISGRSSLLFLDAAAVRDRLKANPWISDATVLKLYPGQLQIDIIERTAFARWQQDGRMAVIAEDGAVLKPYVARRFRRCRWWWARAPASGQRLPRSAGGATRGSLRDQVGDPGRRAALELAAE